MNRIRIKVTGESGMGLLSIGRIAGKALKEHGFQVLADREYPSLIKGGHSCLQVDFSPEPLHSLSREADFMIALDRPGLMEYIETVKEGGVIVHRSDRFGQLRGLQERIQKRNIRLVYCPAREMAQKLGGTEVMVNMVLLGVLWKALRLTLDPLEADIRTQFASKPKLLEIDLKCVRAGYDWEEAKTLSLPTLSPPKPKTRQLLLDGNMALTLGAIHAGVRAYFAYPMSPSSSILSYMANFSHATGILVKQAEDEITAAQMAVGAMFMGTRALVATSGGGFDLMTETFSLAGMVENPLVVIVAQRPGPATGLPTWSGQGDFNLARYAGHGEYSRVVMAASDPATCFTLIQHAFNIAEEFQVPVVLLTEKTIAETHAMTEPFPENEIPLKRGLVTDAKALAALQPSDRYRFTPSGVSPRWIPGSSPTVYCANGDEHEEDGTLTEDAIPVARMMEKRLQKLRTIEAGLPEPHIHGPRKGAAISFVGWGSSLNVMRDTLAFYEKKKLKVNYLHFDYLYPLKTKVLRQFFRDNKNVHLLEGNFEGQFGKFLEAETGLAFKGRLLKYDGRPFFAEDVTVYITHVTLSPSQSLRTSSAKSLPVTQ